HGDGQRQRRGDHAGLHDRRGLRRQRRLERRSGYPRRRVMAADLRIIDTDLREFRAELRKLGVHRDLQKANKRAAEIVVPIARQKGSGSWPNLAGGVSRLGSAGVGTIRALATQTKAYVAAGSAKVVWFG